jgi:Protein of unknown function (DUF993)
VTRVVLPGPDGALAPYEFTGRAVAAAGRQPRTRIAYAAAHVVADPLGGGIDWDATAAYREHLWSLGLGVAEAMDTAQRGMGLPPGDVERLIRETTAAAGGRGTALAVGVATDALPDGPAAIGAVIDAYRAQLTLLGGTRATPVLMASRQLCAAATGPDDYYAVYATLLREVGRPVILHWLGPMFDPQLDGYWGHDNVTEAMDFVVELVADHAEDVAGVKVSLLDPAVEVAFRRRLPPGVVCFSGDDFNYPDLIAGDEHGHSHALLGVFDAIGEVASAALAALDGGDLARYHELFAPTVPLARRLFERPTYHYKTGLVFLAYLRGHQQHFRMLGGAESARGVIHLAELVRLADQAGLFDDPDAVACRLQPVLRLAGIW